MSIQPNPGSAAALQQGCTCPIIDNCHGDGELRQDSPGPRFYLDAACSLHGSNDPLRKLTRSLPPEQQIVRTRMGPIPTQNGTLLQRVEAAEAEVIQLRAEKAATQARIRLLAEQLAILNEPY
jgi:hypothetical protein